MAPARTGQRRRWWPALLFAAGLASAKPARTPARLLILGDSLAAGYGLAQADGFQAQLAAALRARGHDVTFIDAAVSGDTTAGGRARLDWALADGADAALVELGANDGLRGLDPARWKPTWPPSSTRSPPGTSPSCSPACSPPPNLGAAYADAFRAVFARLGTAPRHPLRPVLPRRRRRRPRPQPARPHPPQRRGRAPRRRPPAAADGAAAHGRSRAMRLFVALDLPSSLRDPPVLDGRRPARRPLGAARELPRHPALHRRGARPGAPRRSTTPWPASAPRPSPCSSPGVGTFEKGGKVERALGRRRAQPGAGPPAGQDRDRAAARRPRARAPPLRPARHPRPPERASPRPRSRPGSRPQPVPRGPGAIEHFTLFSSRLGKEQAVYVPEVEYGLQPAAAGAQAVAPL